MPTHRSTAMHSRILKILKSQGRPSPQHRVLVARGRPSKTLGQYVKAHKADFQHGRSPRRTLSTLARRWKHLGPKSVTPLRYSRNKVSVNAAGRTYRQFLAARRSFRPVRTGSWESVGRRAQSPTERAAKPLLITPRRVHALARKLHGGKDCKDFSASRCPQDGFCQVRNIQGSTVCARSPMSARLASIIQKDRHKLMGVRPRQGHSSLAHRVRLLAQAAHSNKF